MSKSIREDDINHLIGKLEVIAAAAEPGTVLTAHMAGFCNETLIKAVNALKATQSTMKSPDVVRIAS
ncbi:hypothetical protein ACPFUK_003328 [Vibrio cholerae]